MLKLLKFCNLSLCNEIVHFQTTRNGGCSVGGYSSLNISFTTGDDPNNVAKNREILAEAVGVPLKNFVMAHQMHTDNVLVVNALDRGCGAFLDSKNNITDAFVTNEKGVMICVKTADCIPVVCYDPIKGVIAAIHAGWSGTAQSITSKTISLMKKRFGTDPKDIIVGIGAGAQKCCYEVDEDVFNQLRSSIPYYSMDDYFVSYQDKYRVDLKRINAIQLEYSGVIVSNIEINMDCTICNPQSYFSWRGKSNDQFGHLVMGIMLR